jgi:hypothetical protein
MSKIRFNSFHWNPPGLLVISIQLREFAPLKELPWRGRSLAGIRAFEGTTLARAVATWLFSLCGSGQ